MTPANTSVPKGQTEQFTATGTFSDNTTENLTSQVTWASSDTICGHDQQPPAWPRPWRPGPSTISATLDGITGSTGADGDRARPSSRSR